MNDVTILIAAAGASARMRGRDKLLETVDSEAQIARVARAALATGAPVCVSLPPDRPARRAALAPLAGPALTLLEIDASEGMSASIRAGAAGCNAQGLMILPADMPELDEGDLRRVIAAFAAAPGAVHRGAGADGTPGHPVIFPARLYPALRGLTGDAGARSLLAEEDVRLTALPGRHALTDLDTPEDWTAWRGNRA